MARALPDGPEHPKTPKNDVDRKLYKSTRHFILPLLCASCSMPPMVGGGAARKFASAGLGENK
eukprot:16446935-Heterocapsa_arctica.AAC.1